MASAGIKNWHWRTKGVEPYVPPALDGQPASGCPLARPNSLMLSDSHRWSKEWFAKELTGVEASGCSIVEVKDVEGDAELGMRKSKLVTIYDQKVSCVVEQRTSERS